MRFLTRRKRPGPQVRDRQMQVLRAVQDYTDQHGRPPAIRDLCGILGLRSTSTVSAHLRTLEHHGLLQAHPLSPRRCVLTAEGAARLAPDTVTSVVSLLGQASRFLEALDAERIDRPFAWAVQALHDIAAGLEGEP